MRFALLLATLPLFAIDDAAIRQLMANRVGTARKAMGIAVGVLDEKGARILVEGRTRVENGRPPDGDTVFEIGSISKAFTSILLADMVERGEVSLDDAVAKFLPKSVSMPAREGRQITLLDLSTQTSGLPRMPNNFKPADPANPYADYTVEQMYQFVSGYTLTRDVGSKYEYSNLGAGLLGHALALRAGKSYEAIVTERILKPLGMSSTSVTLSEGQKSRLATGHNSALEPVKNWDVPTLAGAGALRSTANDMLRLLAASLALIDTPLKKALARAQQDQRPTGQPDLEMAMGWHVFKRFGTRIVWHNGGTGGYRAFAGFAPEKKSAVVVLCNTFLDIDDIGLTALEPQYKAPMLEAPRERKEITLDSRILSQYTGAYEVVPAFQLAITVDGGRIFTQATNQPRLEIFAESETKFFLKAVDAQIEFVKDESGQVNGLVLFQSGRQIRAKRLP
ncbi:MAG: serine hydrolase [Acidobacteria bacterium]|nr:serine hydrolase [Acidobacteriota bacterium]